MNQLDRYIAVEIARVFLLVMLALVFLFSFLDLIKQLDEVGSGDYRFSDALLFELRMLAPRTLDLLPLGALMGTTIALALLANHGEVNAMLASGISMLRFTWGVLKSGILVVLVTVVLDDLVISDLHQEAVRQQALSLSEAELTQVDEGLWIQYNSRFIHIDRVEHGRIPRDIDILELDGERRVNRFIQARQAELGDPNRWLLKDVSVKELNGAEVINEQTSAMYWESLMTREQIGLLELAPETMSSRQLYAYVRYLQGTGQKTSRYELSLWKKLTLPVSVMVMLLLAIPAAFGTPRSSSVEKRVVAAVLAGLIFQIANQVFINSGLVLQLPPPLTTLAAPVVAAIIALVLLLRARI
jgi:lipopolysaccharide export system permease protein